MIFLVLREVEVLDLTGPLQVFHEANRAGANYDIHLCGLEPTVRSAQGVVFGELKPLPTVTEKDLVLLPGIPFSAVRSVSLEAIRWLRRANSTGSRICSICTGAFVLAKAGLLDGRHCTTHWNRIEELTRQYPRAKVLTNRLFVEDGSITTSAGVASGIDLALSIVEKQHGPRVTAAVSREMVVYLRRDGSQKQDSVYLDYRAHLHPGIHRVQDTLIAKPDRRHTLRELAGLANMSQRNLTRVFRQATGISIGAYIEKLRLELAGSLLANPDLTVEAIAQKCGFENSRQLRRIWKKEFGGTPGKFRKLARDADGPIQMP